MFQRIPIRYSPDASASYLALHDLPWSAWLDSAGMARYDILCAQPVRTLVTRGMETEITDAAGHRALEHGDPFDLLRRQLNVDKDVIADIPFAGGVLGYWGYDLARGTFSLPVTPALQKLPDMAFGIYDWAVIFDHHQRTACLVSHLRFAETAAVLPEILSRLDSTTGRSEPEPFRVDGPVRSNMRREEYANAFRQVQDYLREGDCYQVNLAQRFCAEASGDAIGAYLDLRRLSPAPCSAFLNLPEGQVLCVSPERFLRLREGWIETRPIKGTRPRSEDADVDRRLADELRIHPKDRAENLMIVDLLRNDLGKCCVPGSVSVPELFTVESYANVHHLVSTVSGQLGAECDALQAMRACFPGGSITGAPKQRAMQIIDQLEPDPREIYCGSIGYAGFDGNMDSNIAIRTLAYSAGEIRCWAGGGIVADSIMEDEYQETLDKAAAMLRLLRRHGGQ